MIIPENNSLKNEIEEIVRLCEELDDVDGSEFSLPATEEQINVFETDTGIEIPVLYKEWLEFTCSCDIFGGLIRLFMPSTDGYYNKFVPDDYVVIGNMIGDGEKVCFSKKTGKIVRYNHGNISEMKDFRSVLNWIIENLEGNLE